LRLSRINFPEPEPEVIRHSKSPPISTSARIKQRKKSTKILNDSSETAIVVSSQHAPTLKRQQTVIETVESIGELAEEDSDLHRTGMKHKFDRDSKSK